MTEVFGSAIPLLDHGYIKCIEGWGSDERIIEAARMSTDKGFLGWGGTEPCPECSAANRLDKIDGLYRNYELKLEATDLKCKCEGTGKIIGDEKLLRFLYEHYHDSPFEFGGAIVEVMAPISAFREWHRHRTQSYNEMSARYTPLPDLNYVPSVERLLMNSKTNKQAGTIKGADELDEFGARDYQRGLIEQYEADERFYQRSLKMGIPKELARMHLPVGRYSKMRASANLRNWLAFLTLRQAPAAQWEIRQYADAMATIIKSLFPRTHKLFVERQRTHYYRQEHP